MDSCRRTALSSSPISCSTPTGPNQRCLSRTQIHCWRRSQSSTSKRQAAHRVWQCGIGRPLLEPARSGRKGQGTSSSSLRAVGGMAVPGWFRPDSLLKSCARQDAPVHRYQRSGDFQTERSSNPGPSSGEDTTEAQHTGLKVPRGCDPVEPPSQLSSFYAANIGASSR